MREWKTILIEWPDVSFKIHLNSSIVIILCWQFYFYAWISPISSHRHQIITRIVQKWCWECYAIAKCSFNRFHSNQITIEKELLVKRKLCLNYSMNPLPNRFRWIFRNWEWNEKHRIVEYFVKQNLLLSAPFCKFSKCRYDCCLWWNWIHLKKKKWSLMRAASNVRLWKNDDITNAWN